MTDDYPYKITRQDKNLSEVEYLQVSNEVKPVAWMIDVTEQENQYFVGDIEDAMDDLTNHNAVATPLFTSPLSPEEMRYILKALEGFTIDSEGYEKHESCERKYSAIKLLESRL